MEDLDLINSDLLGEEYSDAIGKKLRDKFKKGKDKIKDKIKKGKDKIKDKIKKVTTNLKDKVGKAGKNFRNNFRRVMRKGILFNIKNNIHGVASKLYPAVGNTDVVKQRKYKAKLINASKSIYSKLVSKWKNLGGSEDEIKNAIIEGSKKRFLKMPYKSADGNNGLDFYSYFAPDCNIYYSQDGDEYSYVEGTLSAEGDVEEVPSQEEEVKGIRAFFAWLKGVFKKEGADENPFEEGSPDGKEFDSDKKEDAGNEPSESEANNDIINEVEKTASEDDAGGATDKSKEEDDSDDAEDKFLGMPKAIGITVAIVGGLALIVGGIFLVKKLRK
jgi:hypothetical protein